MCVLRCVITVKRWQLERESWSYKKEVPQLRVCVSRHSTGGDEESRTPVQKFIHIGVSERRHLFTFPYAHAKCQAYALSSSWVVTKAGAGSRSCSPLKWHPCRTAVLSGRMSSLNQAAKATLLLLVNFVYGFYSGSAPLLASDTSKSLSKPLHPHI